MDKKILDFQEMSKHTADPVDKESIFKTLQEVPPDILKEYLDVIEVYIEDLLLIKNIASSRKRRALFDHLTKNITQEQISKLNKIALNLAAIDPLLKISELAESTFNVVIPTEETRSKATKLVDQLKSLDLDYSLRAKELAVFSRQMALLADIFAVLNQGKEFTDVTIERLSIVPDSDLDFLLKWCGS